MGARGHGRTALDFRPSPPPVGGVGGVHWPAVCADFAAVPARFLGSLGGVVVLLAKRLVVARIPEQRLIALVRDDVVNHGCGSESALPLAVHAQRVICQVVLSVALPSCAIPALGSLGSWVSARHEKARSGFPCGQFWLVTSPEHTTCSRNYKPLLIPCCASTSQVFAVRRLRCSRLAISGMVTPCQYRHLTSRCRRFGSRATALSTSSMRSSSPG